MSSKSKTKELQELLGEHIYLFFRSASIIEDIDPSNPVIGTGIRGYVIDVSDHFIYLGGNPDQYDIIISMDEIGIIRLIPERTTIVQPTHSGNENAH